MFSGIKFTDSRGTPDLLGGMPYMIFTIGDRVKRQLLNMKSPLCYEIKYFFADGSSVIWNYVEENTLINRFENGVYIEAKNVPQAETKLSLA